MTPTSIMKLTKGEKKLLAIAVAELLDLDSLVKVAIANDDNIFVVLENEENTAFNLKVEEAREELDEYDDDDDEAGY